MSNTLPWALATDLEGTFAQVVVTFQDQLYRFALRYCGDRRDAEEITQDAFLRAYRALCTYDAARITQLALRPWLYQITLNVARNHARKRQPPTVPFATDDQGESMPFPDPTPMSQPEQFAEHHEQSAMLANLITDLPPRYRAAIILRHIEGLTYPEVAVILNTPLGTVKANIHRANRQLQAAWQQAQATERNHHVSVNH